MRLARLKPVSGTYYHVMNRIAGEKNFYPFDHKEKQMDGWGRVILKRIKVAFYQIII